MFFIIRSDSQMARLMVLCENCGDGVVVKKKTFLSYRLIFCSKKCRKLYHKKQQSDVQGNQDATE